MFSWFKTRRRRKLLAEPFPPEWLRLLERRVPYYAYLSPEQKSQFQGDLRIFIAEKLWVGCGGMEITDETRVVIAAQACLLVLAIRPTYHYDRIKSILVYPAPFSYSQRTMGTVVRSGVLLGEAWHRSPIILAWSGVEEAARHPHSGENLVFHEFAHHLDGLDGEMDGAPPLESREQYRAWDKIVDLEFNRLKQAAREGQPTLLDQYGATSRAEFFAVATECFFTRGADLRAEHPELYEALRGFYRQDPAAWPVPVAVADGPSYPISRRGDRWRSSRRIAIPDAPPRPDDIAGDDIVRQLRLKPGSADAHFTLGVAYFNREQFASAVSEFSTALEMNPDDAETLRHRGLALLRLGEPAEAIADLSAAILLDDGDIDAYRARAEANLMTGEPATALADAAVALRRNWRDAIALRIRGLALAATGRSRQAIRTLTSAIHADPNQAETYAARSHLYELLGEADRAERDRVEALRRDPRLATALLRRGERGV